MRIFEYADYNLIGNRKIAYTISAIIILVSLIGIFVKGLQYGIDFKGGKEFVVEFSTEASVTDVRSTLTDPFKAVPEVKKYGDDNTLLIRTDALGDINTLQGTITESMQRLYPETDITIIKTDIVGPRFAEDLKQGALYAIVASIIVIFVYILMRFRKWTYSAGAVAALLHDVIITLGIFTLLNDILPFNLTIDQTIIAAFLTIVGYSLNDTVVVFDRIRENSLIFKTMPYNEMVNKSINNTLSRTIVTSATTFIVVFILFLFGGEVLKGLSFALMVGIIIGTYSSIFVASTLVVDLNKNNK